MDNLTRLIKVNKYINKIILLHIWHGCPLSQDSVSLSEWLRGRGPGVGGGRHVLPGARVHRLRDVREVRHRAPQYRGPQNDNRSFDKILVNNTDTREGSEFDLILNFILESLMLTKQKFPVT